MSEEVFVFEPSFAQERVWFIEQLQPGTSTYNIPVALRLYGRLDAHMMQQALDQIVATHEILRTVFATMDGGLVQVVKQDARIILKTGDLSHLTANALEAEIHRRADAEAQEVFDLRKGPLMRIQLLHINAQDHVMLLTLHHIIADGWSLGVLVRELALGYEAVSRGLSHPLPELPIQYGDYAQWQREWLAQEEARLQSYWLQRLQDCPKILELVTDKPRPVARSLAGGSFTTLLPTPLLRALRTVSDQDPCPTLFMTLLSLYGVLLGRYSGQEDILVGFPIANRELKELEAMIGFFANTLVLRTDLSGNPSLRTLMSRVRQSTLDAYAHQAYPFEKLVEQLNPERALGHTPIFQAMIILQNAHLMEAQLPNLTFELIQSRSVSAKFDLTLSMVEQEEGLACTFEYSADLFHAATITRMGRQFRMLCEALTADPDQQIQQLSLLDDHDRRQVLETWQDQRRKQPKKLFFHQHFELIAQKRAHQPALCDGTTTLSYDEVNRAANRMAHMLRAQLPGPEAPVAVMMERGVGFWVTVLALLKSGAVYVPLDRDNPAERLWLICEDVTPVLILASPELEALLPHSIAPVTTVQEPHQAWWEYADHNPAAFFDPTNLAYIIYTSGSTGRPKGVMLTHRNLAHLGVALEPLFAGTPDRRVLQFASPTFDVSLSDMLIAWQFGGCLVPIDRASRLEPEQLTAFMHDKRICHATLPPAMLRYLDPQELTNVAVMVSSGEACPAELARLWSKGRRFINGYGPTEATVYAAMGTCSATEPGPPPIGRPLPLMPCYVADPHYCLQAPGIPGELLIGGEGLARGYLGRPALTADRFRPDPHNKPGSRLYQSGDLVRWRHDGRIDFLGRMDFQLKLRGFRIEPAEIEAVLREHPTIEQAVVQLWREDQGEPQLVAWLEVDASAVGTDAWEGRLKDHLQRRLPLYMIPSQYVLVDRIPLSSNGKMDRKALLTLGPSRNPPRVSQPQSAVARELAEIWEEILERPNIGMGDNFFSLGGHSLLATRVTSRVGVRFGVTMTPRDFFEHPTLARQAHFIATAAVRQDGGHIYKAPRGERMPLSFAQERLWFLDRLEGPSSTYTIPTVLQLRGRLSVGCLNRALELLLQRHESLRTCFLDMEGIPVASIATTSPLILKVVDLSGIPDEERKATCETVVEAAVSGTFHLHEIPLWRLTLIRLDAQEFVLVLLMHHIIGDGWSAGIFVSEVASLYQALVEGHPDAARQLPDLPIQYADYAHWQRENENETTRANQLAWWRTHLEGAPERLNLPTDHQRPSKKRGAGASLEFSLPPITTREIQLLAESLGTTPFTIFLGAFGILLGRTADCDDLVIGTPVAGRNRSELEGLIGFFVNTLALRLKLSPRADSREFLEQLSHTILDAFNHGELPFGKLVEALNPQRESGHMPLFQAMIVLQNTPLQKVETPDLTLQPVALGSRAARFDLTLILAQQEDATRVIWEYDAQLFHHVTISRMNRHFRAILDLLIQAPDSCISQWDLLTAGERRCLLEEWQGGQAHPSPNLIELFAAHASAHPNDTALSDGDQSLDYRTLAHESNQLAHALVARGMGTEDRVALAMKRGISYWRAVLAVLKAGAAFVPLDIEAPAERLLMILKDAAPSLLIRDRTGTELLPNPGVAVMAEAEDRGSWTTHDLQRRHTHAHMAYVLFTSGSTGRPKGVMVTHGGLANLARVQKNRFQVDRRARVLQFANTGFDASVWEMNMALSAGAALIVADDRFIRDPASLVQFIQRTRITHATLSPVVLRQQSPADLREVNALISAGDPCEQDLAQLWAPERHFFNAYGPTETTVCATMTRLHPKDPQPPSIGRALEGTEAYVVNRHLALVPVGLPGELVVSGVHLGRGYLSQPAMTATRFIPNPFGSPGSRLYRSGDRARYREDGQIMFLGRVDHQVKIRGCRVEPGEVEVVLRAHPNVAECAVIPRSGRDGTLTLHAFVKLVEDTAGTADVRAYLALRLPTFMRPSWMTPLTTLPMLPSGKIDRRKLLEHTPDKSGPHGGAGVPRTRLEWALCNLWAEVLGLEEVGYDQDFFALGGHSLSAVKLMDRIHVTLGTNRPLSTLFNHSTPATLAAVLSANTTQPSREVMVPLRATGSRPPLFCIHPVGGNVFAYLPLARALNSDLPVYGIQHPGLEGPPTQANITTLAESYLQMMETRLPSDSYHVCGWSMGGLIAFEMAKILDTNGKLGELILLDSYPPDSAVETIPPAHAALAFLRDLTAQAGFQPDHIGSPPDALTWDGCLDWVMETLEQHPFPPIEPTTLKRLWLVFQANFKALGEYRLRGRVKTMTLIQATHTKAAEKAITQWCEHTDAPRVIQLPTNHYTLLRDPHLARVCQEIEALIPLPAADMMCPAKT